MRCCSGWLGSCIGQEYRIVALFTASFELFRHTIRGLCVRRMRAVNAVPFSCTSDSDWFWAGGVPEVLCRALPADGQVYWLASVGVFVSCGCFLFFGGCVRQLCSARNGVLDDVVAAVCAKLWSELLKDLCWGGVRARVCELTSLPLHYQAYTRCSGLARPCAPALPCLAVFLGAGELPRRLVFSCVCAGMVPVAPTVGAVLICACGTGGTRCGLMCVWYLR